MPTLVLTVNRILRFNIFHFSSSRDVPGVEVLMEQHQNRKVEIDARDDSFDDVVKMGKDLIARNHYATPEVFIFYLIFCHTTNMMKTKKIERIDLTMARRPKER